jgi:preprotein translocase subunit Sec61beta
MSNGENNRNPNRSSRIDPVHIVGAALLVAIAVTAFLYFRWF